MLREKLGWEYVIPAVGWGALGCVPKGTSKKYARFARELQLIHPKQAKHKYPQNDSETFFLILALLKLISIPPMILLLTHSETNLEDKSKKAK